MSAAAEAEAIDALKRFCTGFADRDPDAVLQVAGEAGDLVVVTSEEPATTGDREERHPYRMTMVLERRDEGWIARQVHGSSPH